MRRATSLATIVLAAVAFSRVESTRAQGIKPPPAPPPAKPWKKVLEVEGELTIRDLIDPVQNPDRGFGCRHKVHLFPMVRGRTYQIDMMSLTRTKRPFLPASGWDKWDNYLRLEDPQKKQLAFNDDIQPGAILDARIENFKCPRSGEYRIIATSFEPNEMGRYKLIVWQYGTGEEATYLDPSQGEDQTDGTLPKAGDTTIDKKRPFSTYKLHTVKMAAGKTYQIDLTSKDFDAYLRLQDPKGKDLASDDNSGGGLDARITFKCPKDGEYRILASSAFGGKGAYTLTVKQQK
jgi:hypothetical protein